MTLVFKGVQAEKLWLLSQTMLGMCSKPDLQMVPLLPNNGTMSRVPNRYSTLCNLQNALPSLGPEYEPALGGGAGGGGSGAVVTTRVREVKQCVQDHTASRQQNQAEPSSGPLPADTRGQAKP